jgi:hypothetical protein
MIARIWRGWTTPANADAYQRIVCQEVLPGIAARNLEGYHGAYLLRRDLDGEVEFATILLFDSLEQVRAFAGEDYETAYVPPRTGGAGPLRRALSPLRHAVTAAHDLTRPGRRAGRLLRCAGCLVHGPRDSSSCSAGLNPAVSRAERRSSQPAPASTGSKRSRSHRAGAQPRVARSPCRRDLVCTRRVNRRRIAA